MIEKFFIFSYKNGVLAIGFDDDIKIKNIDHFKKYKNVTLDGDIIDPNTNNTYKALYFKDVDDELIKFYCDILNIEHNKDRDLSLEILFDKLSSIFKTKEKEVALKKYLGFLSELSLIKYCLRNNVNIIDYYSHGNVDVLDFHFPSNFNLEVKYLNQNESFHTSYKQLNAITNSKKNNYVLFKPYYDSINGENLHQILESIPDSNRLNKVYSKVVEMLEEFPDIFNEYKIDISKSEFYLIDKEKLPIIQLKEKNTIISANFSLFAYILKNVDVVDYIRGILCE